MKHTTRTRPHGIGNAHTDTVIVHEECPGCRGVSYGFGPDMSAHEIERFLADQHHEDCPERRSHLDRAHRATFYLDSPDAPTLAALVHELRASLTAQRDHLDDLTTIVNHLATALWRALCEQRRTT